MTINPIKINSSSYQKGEIEKKDQFKKGVIRYEDMINTVIKIVLQKY